MHGYNFLEPSCIFYQKRTQELAEGCCIDEALQGLIKEFALGAARTLLFRISPVPFPSLPHCFHLPLEVGFP